MKYFITGATGFVGNRLAGMLVERGHDVIALFRTPDKAKGLVSQGVKVFKGDITDKESMLIPMEGCDGAFHMAA